MIRRMLMTSCLFEHNRNRMFWLHNDFDFNLIVQILDNEPFHSNNWGLAERYSRALAWMDPVVSDAVNACPDTVASTLYLHWARIVSRSHSGSRPSVWKHPDSSWQIWALGPEAFWHGCAACVPLSGAVWQLQPDAFVSVARWFDCCWTSLILWFQW